MRITDDWEAHPSTTADYIAHLLIALDPDPGREGLEETPLRVAKAWEEHTSGYGVDPTSILKSFSDGASNYNEMVIVKDIRFYSHCEHHLEPIIGLCTIGYIPNLSKPRIVGLSKLARLVDVYAKRLQVQERMTTDILGALWAALDPHGAGVVIRARHLCMESRGVCKHGNVTLTQALGGAFFEGDPRSEFLRASESNEAI